MLSAGEIIQTALWIFAIGTGSLLLAIYLLQDKLLYFPGMPPDAKTVFIPASQFGLRHALQEVFLTTPDNVKLQVNILLLYFCVFKPSIFCCRPTL